MKEQEASNTRQCCGPSCHSELKHECDECGVEPRLDRVTATQRFDLMDKLRYLDCHAGKLNGIPRPLE